MAQQTVTVDGLRGYLVRPERPATAGVLVLPTIAGIEERLRDYCAWLIEAGLLALAWDPFSAYPADLPVQERLPIGRDQLDDRPARQEQLRWLDYLYGELRLERVGVMGFCLGGRMVFPLAAGEPRIHACVAYHPSIYEAPPPPLHLDAVAAAREVPCPVQVLYPGRDHVTSQSTLHALRAALESRAAPTAVHVYPGAEHGFMEAVNPVTGHDRRSNPANVEATRLAWPQTAAFLRACLL